MHKTESKFCWPQLSAALLRRVGRFIRSLQRSHQDITFLLFCGLRVEHSFLQALEVHRRVPQARERREADRVCLRAGSVADGAGRGGNGMQVRVGSESTPSSTCWLHVVGGVNFISWAPLPRPTPTTTRTGVCWPAPLQWRRPFWGAGSPPGTDDLKSWRRDRDTRPPSPATPLRARALDLRRVCTRYVCAAACARPGHAACTSAGCRL